MTIQYPNKLDPKRKIYFAIDNVYGGTGSPTAGDRKIQNTIVNKLKAAGLNVVKSEMGPGTLYDNMVAVYNAGETNAIMFHVVNGVDPSNLREIAINGNDNRGRITRSRGNDIVMGYMCNSCDPTPGGRCADHVQGSETGGGMRNPGPAEYMRTNKIYAIVASSDERTKMANADWTGETISQKFIDLFEWGDEGSTPDPTPVITPTPSVTPDVDTTKTISTKTITQYYTSPHYEEVLKAKTDDNGAFKVKPQLPYKGKYKVHIRYGGDKTHNNATATTYIYNFSKYSTTFKEKLLQTITVITYTDSTSTTTTEGSTGTEKNLKKVVTTEKYENGVLKETTSKTTYTNDIVEVNSNPNIDNTNTPSTNPTPNTIPDNSNNNVGTKINPFTQDMPLLNGVPDVARMAISNKEFEMVDLNKCYVLSEAQFTAVMNRDSRTLQVNNYKNSKYTFFETSSSDKYVVLERERWNCIEESLHAYRVEYNGDYDNSKNHPPAPWPKFVNIDFVNKRTICYTDENDVVREITGMSDEVYRQNHKGIFEHWWDGNNNYLEKRNYHWLADAQDTGYTCGPTASSMCLQVLHCYIPETTLAGKMGTDSGGTGPEGIRDGFNKYSHLKAETVSNTKKEPNKKKETAKAELLAGRPYVAHMSGHYFALTDLFLEQDKLLICNSGRSGGATGWHSWSSQSQGFDYGQTVKIQLNYTITEQEKSELLHCVASMGGSWTRPYNQEKLRRYGGLN